VSVVLLEDLDEVTGTELRMRPTVSVVLPEDLDDVTAPDGALIC
jgi:hypothetical protein